MFDTSQQAGWASGSEDPCSQSLAAFGLSQLDIEGRLCTLQNPPGVKMNVTVPTAEQNDNFLLWNQIDLVNLLAVCSTEDHCRERQRLLIYRNQTLNALV